MKFAKLFVNVSSFIIVWSLGASLASAQTTAPATQAVPVQFAQSACAVVTDGMPKNLKSIVDKNCELERALIQRTLDQLELAKKAQELELKKLAARTVESVENSTTTTEGFGQTAEINGAIAGAMAEKGDESLLSGSFADVRAAVLAAGAQNGVGGVKTSTTTSYSKTPSAAKHDEKVLKIQADVLKAQAKYAYQAAHPCSGGFLNVNRFTPGCYGVVGGGGVVGGSFAGGGIVYNGGFGGGVSSGRSGVNSTFNNGVAITPLPTSGTPGNHVGVVGTDGSQTIIKK